MRKVIISAAGPGADCAMDLEVPADLAAEMLAELLVRALLGEAGGDFRVEAHPPGRLLEPGETLAGVGAWDGAWLLLRR